MKLKISELPKFRRAYLLDSRRRRGCAVLKCLPVGVDRRADAGVACVVPHGGAVGTGGRGVHVVAQELVGQRVGTGTSRITGRAPVGREVKAPVGAPPVGLVGVQDHTDEGTGIGRVGPERCGESVVDDGTGPPR